MFTKCIPGIWFHFVFLFFRLCTDMCSDLLTFGVSVASPGESEFNENNFASLLTD